MDKNISGALKKVIIADLIIAAILSAVVQVLFKGYAAIVFLGAAVAIINFAFNSISGEYIFIKLNISPVGLYLLGFLIRIVFAAVIGFVVYTYNKYNVIAYMFGYSVHFVGVIIYTISLAKIERK